MSIRKIIDRPQKSDMGSGFGHYEISEHTSLAEVLNWIEKNENCWGDIRFYRDGKFLCKISYGNYFNEEFPPVASMIKEDNILVAQVKFDYCFMKKDIDIYLI